MTRSLEEIQADKKALAEEEKQALKAHKKDAVAEAKHLILKHKLKKGDIKGKEIVQNHSYLSRRSVLAGLTFPLFLPLLTISACSSVPYNQRLFTATQITKLNGIYFIVDCWHHRILYSSDINSEIQYWNVLDDDIAGPHSIASDGNVFVAEDTGRHALKVYVQKQNNEFELVQVVPNIGIRPHRVLYDSTRDQFVVIGSKDQRLFLLNLENNELRVVSSQRITELQGQYCRSITIRDNLVYMVGIRDIVVFHLNKGSLGTYVKTVRLNSQYEGSNDLYFINDESGLLTSSPKKIVYFSRLSQLEKGNAQDLSSAYEGTPYYISFFDNKLWVPEIIEHTAIHSISGNPSDHGSKITQFDFGLPNRASLNRKGELPL